MSKFDELYENILDESKDWSEEDIAQWLLRNVRSLAARYKSTRVETGEFYKDQFKFMNDKIFPAYEKFGSPLPYTKKMEKFLDQIPKKFFKTSIVK